MKRFAVKTTIQVMEPAAQAFYEEGDLEFAREAMPANLKMMEGLLKSVPDDEALLSLLAQGYCSYSFAFLEDSEKSGDLDRAKMMYKKGFQFGLRALPESVRAHAGGNLEKFENALNDIKDVAPLFWSAYCLGSWVNINKQDVDAVGELIRVELMMKRALALDEEFYHGSIHLFYGAYFGGRPKMLGGSAEKAKEHLDKAITLRQGRFLMPKLYYAQFYAVPTQNEELFERTLREVLEASPELMPEERLANQVAKRRAAKLLKQKKDLF